MCTIHHSPPRLAAAAPRAAQTGPDIPLDEPWKEKVYEFTRDHLQHSAWGLHHSERDYLMSLEIARQSQMTVDKDVLFAAAMLHDMGGFAEFAKTGVDHAERSAEVCDQVLRPAGFPEEKIEPVRQAIRTHSYYSKEVPQTPEAVALHDADCLDFLGAIGVARILSLTEREPFTPTLESAVKLAENLKNTAGEHLYSGEFARATAATRINEMDAFLGQLKQESFSSRYL